MKKVEKTNQNSLKLTEKEEIQNLTQIHEFLSEYDRVPGSYATQWAKVLDGLASVVNSLITKLNDSERK